MTISKHSLKDQLKRLEQLRGKSRPCLSAVLPPRHTQHLIPSRLGCTRSIQPTSMANKSPVAPGAIQESARQSKATETAPPLSVSRLYLLSPDSALLHLG